MSKVFIAAGHGGADPGAVGNGTNERDLTIQIVNQAAALLSAQDMKGRQLVIVPHHLGLVDSINWINANTTDKYHDLCIEVHLNAGGGDGVEVFYFDGIATSKAFAQELLEPLVLYTGLPSRGVKSDATTRFGRLGFIRDTEPLASLIELGFIDDQDAPATNDVAVVREKGGKALAAAILKSCDSAYVEPRLVEQPKPVTPVETPAEKPQVPQPEPAPVTPTPPVVVEQPKVETPSPKGEISKTEIIASLRGGLYTFGGIVGAQLVLIAAQIQTGRVDFKTIGLTLLATFLSIFGNIVKKTFEGK